MHLFDLKVNHECEKLGVDRSIFFSWKLGSEEKDTFQTSYRITVSDSEKSVWDSGIIESGSTLCIPYKGPSLESMTKYYFTVIAKDNHGNEAQATSWFETAMLKKEDWRAVFVADTKKYQKRKKGFGNQAAATVFRKDFIIPDDIRQARLYATAYGVYEVSVNGSMPDDRVLAPEYSSYDKYLCYQTYDISNLLKKGENVLGFTVADGWYFCPETTMNKKTAAKPHAIFYQAEIVTAEGKRYTVCSDGSERAFDSAVLSSDLFAGELYDQNKELEGWDIPGFDDSGFRSVKPIKTDLSILAAQIGEPVRRIKELPVKEYYVSPKGEHILDFGQVMAGRVRFRTDLKKGEKIILEHFEIPDTSGNYFNNILGMVGVGEGTDQKVEFISAGREAVYEARFTFHGFRYVKVSGIENIDPSDFTAVVISTDSKELGNFNCSDERLNRLYLNTRWSQYSNMISIPTDCPQREKAGWTGDIGVYAATSLQNEDTTGLLTRWLASLAKDQGKDGAVPIVVPLNQTYKNITNMIKLAVNHGRGLGSAGWGDACHLVPLAMYRQTGNTTILKECWPVMKAWGDYIIKASLKRGNKEIPKEVDRYLWNSDFHFGEWLIPSSSKNGISAGNDMMSSIKEGKKYIPEIYSYITMKDLAETAEVLGLAGEKEYYEEYGRKVLNAFKKGVISEDGKMPVDVMGAYIIPLHYGLVPEELRERFMDEIIKKIDENEGCLDTGFLGTPVILDTLSENGYQEKAYDILFQNKCPSWLFEVESGGTTIWESWITKEADGTPMAVSLNHYAFGCVDDWMFRNISGIVPTSPGYRTFTVDPKMDKRLTSACRTFESEYGLIASSWKLDDGVFEMDVTVPPCTSAEIRLPSGKVCGVGSGTYHFSCAYNG